ncbi:MULTISPECIES: DUF4136 domain-containing protein [unclassified Lentimonas]|uniref:DUF4136 domain-containing protein n=1 Tax=unclassified Lentimonas TaxID=2630993 RepID=UPI00132310DC|nr:MULTISPECIES: DUF4136 domain-containing protein [unclassified Lentimonas]CAA6678589.1 Unannotated [Lentimonas sp. CC4]CAA6685821.1 Unannotated [Lentimonas sp. CC6]CAA7076295.1 Unannotated [Lentimonas sp. CC4]CAA7171961.1 Unannotated [Lentimonas sp. CC21]CAA7181550.1 Unannotated [Lentimonas sp. CC8]
MKNWIYILKILVPGLLLGTMMGSAQSQPSTDELVKNPSFHILVNHEQKIPSTGTFDFDTKLFKIDYKKEFDLHVVDQRIVGALETGFNRKGLKYDSKKPDLFVSYAVAFDAGLTGAEFNAAYATEFPISVPEPEPGQELNYHQGTLIVDVVDAKSRILLWRGSIMVKLDMDISEADKDRRVQHIVRVLLEHFPNAKL